MGSILDSIRATLTPIRREGLPFVAAFVVAGLILGWLWMPLFWLFAVLAAWCVYFFRDPPRVTPQEPGLVVSPADGRISFVGAGVAPGELDLGEGPRQRISVFMNVFNCHVNRAPIGGRVGRIAYTPGKFFNAELDKASADNERNAIRIEAAGGPIGVVQIAGLVARRIVCFVREGQGLVPGERLGLIRFGSRLDVWLPAGADVLVAVGQTAIAGETVIARLDRPPAAHPVRRD